MFTVLLLLAGKCIFPRKVDGIALLWRKLFNAGAYLLLLGLCFEPFQDGIKKDPTTFSYFFVTSGHHQKTSTFHTPEIITNDT